MRTKHQGVFSDFLWERGPISSDNVILWAACTLAFFRFLRIGKFVVPTLERYDPTVHLFMSDVVFHHPTDPAAMFVTIKSSKTDPFRMV